MLGLIEDGFVPCPFAEGGYETRLEVIPDLPPGRTAWHFDRTDMRRAKAAMGGIACIEGNVPPSLLNLGTPDEVTAYCRDLIDGVAPGGGFILNGGAVIDEAKEENMRAMIQAAKEYGVY
jgi:uroporphyrinogen-III decarboxylase